MHEIQCMKFTPKEFCRQEHIFLAVGLKPISTLASKFAFATTILAEISKICPKHYYCYLHRYILNKAVHVLEKVSRSRTGCGEGCRINKPTPRSRCG